MPRKRSRKRSRRLSPSTQKIVINYVQNEVKNARPGKKDAVFATAVSLAAIGLVGVGAYAAVSVSDATRAVRDLCVQVFDPDAWKHSDAATEALQRAIIAATTHHFSIQAAFAAGNAAYDAIMEGKTKEEAALIAKQAAENIYKVETGQMVGK